MAGEFEGRGVLVCGAEVGVGPAVVTAFRDAGARVATDAGAKDRAAAALLDAAEREAGAVDVLVLSARPVTVANFLEVGEGELREVIESELVWYALMMQEAARRMVEKGGGRIINFVSMSGKTGVHPHVGPYAAAKGGIIALSRVMAAELAPSGVTVNAIATALMEPQVAHHPEERRKQMLTGIPVRRFGRVEEAARAALYLASDDAGYVTGETLNLSGGRFMD